MNRSVLSLILLSILFIVNSPQVHAINLEWDLQGGIQNSWPIAAQGGIGAAANLTYSSNLVVFPFVSLDLYKIEYIDENVMFKEYNAGVGTKYISSGMITRFTVAKMFRQYNGLSDESYRFGLGFGKSFGMTEVTLNYYNYTPLDKRAISFVVGFIL